MTAPVPGPSVVLANSQNLVWHAAVGDRVTAKFAHVMRRLAKHKEILWYLYQQDCHPSNSSDGCGQGSPLSRGNKYEYNCILPLRDTNIYSVLKANIYEIASDKIPITLYHTAPLYNVMILYDTILRQKRNFKTRKIMNSTLLPCSQFGMNSQGFSAARLTWPGLGRRQGKLKNIALSENIASLLHRHVDVPCSLVVT